MTVTDYPEHATYNLLAGVINVNPMLSHNEEGGLKNCFYIFGFEVRDHRGPTLECRLP
jgi:hypothetical protein